MVHGKIKHGTDFFGYLKGGPEGRWGGGEEGWAGCLLGERKDELGV